MRVAFLADASYIWAMPNRSRRIAAIAVAAALAAGAAYTAYWYSAAAGVRAGIDRWADQRRAAGWEVTMNRPQLGGFPFRIDLVIDGATIAGPASAARWRWTPPSLSASARPWAPGRIAVDGRSTHKIDTGDGVLTARLAEAEGDLVAGADALREAVVRFSGIDLALPDGSKLTAGSLILHLKAQSPIGEAGPDSGTRGLGLAFDARTVALPGGWNLPLGAAIEKVSADAIVAGSIDPHGSVPEILGRWRDAGGALEVKALAVDWRALKLRAGGTFALDENLQPQGAVTAEIDGIDPTADALIAAGMIDPRTAFAAKVANRALTLGGGPARLPVTIQNQQLYLGPVPLLRFKPVRWE